MLSLIALLVEPAMYVGIGFLAAILMSLPLYGVTHRRAERLTKQHLNSRLPMSVKELESEKDLLRAEFAVSAQRLGSTLDDLKAKTAAQQIEIGRHGGTVARLRSELGDKARTICALEAREAALRQQLQATEQEHALKSVHLDDVRRALVAKEAELARLAGDLDTRTVIAEQQNIALAGARTDVEALKIKVADDNRELDALNARLMGHREETTAASRQLADERGKVENLGRRVADLELELIAQRDAADALTRITAGRICEQARRLAERDYEADRMQVALDAAHRAEAGLRYELTRVEERRMTETKAALAEKAALEMQIARLQLDRQQLQWEVATLRQGAENSQAADRVENAMMRKRIGEATDQAAALRTALAPVAAIADGDGRPDMNGTHGGTAVNGHDAQDEARFGALDTIFVRELPAREETAPHPGAN